jgi:hypothetical protein
MESQNGGKECHNTDRIVGYGDLWKSITVFVLKNVGILFNRCLYVICAYESPPVCDENETTVEVSHNDSEL